MSQLRGPRACFETRGLTASLLSMRADFERRSMLQPDPEERPKGVSRRMAAGECAS
jgi:hypothetical protein